MATLALALKITTTLSHWFESLRASPRATIVPLNSALLERGLRLFKERQDKDWSLTDCVSFVVMQDESVREALTGDQHFEQAGFVALLK